MNKKVLKYLLDIQNCIGAIKIHLVGNVDFFEYQRNITIKRAVEREFEIIGEALNNAIKIQDELQDLITDARKIVGLRNYIIHSYDSITDANIWGIINKNLPILEIEIEKLLNA